MNLMSSILEVVLSSDLSKLKLLLESGFKINSSIPKTEGHTLLHIAAGVDSFNQEKIVNFLLKEGADPNINCHNGFTPVHISAMWGHDNILKILLKNGGNPWMVDNEGKNALDISKQCKESNCVTVLENFTEEIDEKYTIAKTVQKLNNKGEKQHVPSKELYVSKNNSETHNECTSHHKRKLSLHEGMPCKNSGTLKLYDKVADKNSPSILFSKMTVLNSEDKNHEAKLFSFLEQRPSLSNETLSLISILADDSELLCRTTNFLDKSSLLHMNTAFLEESYEKCSCISHNNEYSNDKCDRIVCCQYQLENDLLHSRKDFSCVTERNLFSSNKAITGIEEYEHTDVDEGITLIECCYPSYCSNTENSLHSEYYPSAPYDSLIFQTALESLSSSSLHLKPFEDLSKLTNSEIRQQLISFGDNPGPVIHSTREIYIRKLAKLKVEHINPSLKIPSYSSELLKIMEKKLDILKLASLEELMCKEFQQPDPNKKWREGTQKIAFTYLLLNPIVTCNLPIRAPEMSFTNVFRTFIEAIFYIGKGTRTRPFAHFYEAVQSLNLPLSKVNDKIKKIISIWSSGLGVVSLHCFQNTIPVEAYTREACMVEAVGLSHLTNERRGNYYGSCSSWTATKKCQLGAFLLYRAMNIFLNEGERQIKPKDIKK